MTITCADCGRTQTIPDLAPGAVAECHRCDRLLARRTRSGVDVTLACAIAGFLLLPPAVLLPLMQSSLKHLLFEQSRLVSSVPVIYREVWFPFAVGFLLFAVLFPLARNFLQILTLGAVRLGIAIPEHGRLFRWSEELRIWSMTDVVVIAGAVAWVRADIPADVEILTGAWCYLAVAVLAITGDRFLDRRAVWDFILPDPATRPADHTVSCGACERAVRSRRPGDPCPRCGATLDRDIARLFVPSLIALAAAIPLSVPAWSFAVIVNDQLTGVWEHTIVGTVQLLADRGYWQFGVVVLVAGVVIPFVELLGLAWLLARVWFPSSGGLVRRTRIHRLLRRLVRLPMIIPFIAAIAAPIIDFRGVDDIVAGPGATPLFLLIALLMLSARLFEPRLMWKTAGEAR